MQFFSTFALLDIVHIITLPLYYFLSRVYLPTLLVAASSDVTLTAVTLLTHCPSFYEDG